MCRLSVDSKCMYRFVVDNVWHQHGAPESELGVGTVGLVTRPLSTIGPLNAQDAEDGPGDNAVVRFYCLADSSRIKLLYMEEKPGDDIICWLNIDEDAWDGIRVSFELRNIYPVNGPGTPSPKAEEAWWILPYSIMRWLGIDVGSTTHALFENNIPFPSTLPLRTALKTIQESFRTFSHNHGISYIALLSNSLLLLLVNVEGLLTAGLAPYLDGWDIDESPIFPYLCALNIRLFPAVEGPSRDEGDYGGLGSKTYIEMLDVHFQLGKGCRR